MRLELKETEKLSFMTLKSEQLSILIKSILIKFLIKSENLYFDQILLSKAYKDLDEKVQKTWSHDTKEWYKVWRKTDSSFQKWHEEFGKF